jgi:tetratricopeptide (TPR) repeat protein
MIDESSIGYAIDQYRQLAANEADDYDLSEVQLNGLGRYYLNCHDYDRAIALFRLNAEIFPNSPIAHNSLGEAHMLMGDNNEAASQFRRSLELKPDDADAARMLEQIPDSSN